MSATRRSDAAARRLGAGALPGLGLALLLLVAAAGCSSPRAFGPGAAWACGHTWECTANEALRANGGRPHLPVSPAEPLAPIRAQSVEVDYFQGLLARVGIPFWELPKDGRQLEPRQAARLLLFLAAADVRLRDWGPARMASHLLVEVASGTQPVPREGLHQRMRRFQKLYLLRPDGYLVRATTGEAIQQVGEAHEVARTLRAEGLEVGPFYVAEGFWLYPVRAETLARDMEAPPAGLFKPQQGLVAHAVLGVGDAVIDTLQGLLTLVLHPLETLQGLARLPSAVRVLMEQSREYWERYRALPAAEQARQAARLVSGVLLTCGTAGAGAAKAASVGGRLGRLGVPALSLTGQGALAVRWVALPAGQLVTTVGTGASAFYVLHMASRGAGSGSPGGRTPPAPAAKVPGAWKTKKPSGSLDSQRYQEQISGRPASEVYIVDGVEFDGFPDNKVLREAKAESYEKFFTPEGDPRHWYDELLDQADRQNNLAERLGVPLEWHVAEERAADILRKIFKDVNFNHIQVIHTPMKRWRSTSGD